MRPLLPGCALVVVASFACACSRKPPSADASPPRGPAAPPPIALVKPAPTGAALRLATAVVDTADAGATVDAPAPPSLAGKTVLHIGDSMVGGSQGLTKALEQRFTSEGARFLRDYKVSESIVSFDHSPKLKRLIDKHQPDIVIITLGANDVFVPYPASITGHVQNIVKRVAGRECYWIGPPTWKPDTGIVNVLRDNVAPCKFFDSSDLKLQRGGDGIHPTDQGGAQWASSFWTYFRPDAGEGAAIAIADAGLAPP